MPTVTEELITTTTLSSPSSSITLSSIPSTYTDLRLVVVQKNTTTNYASYLRFNNDSTSANYAQTYFYAAGSSVASSGMLTGLGLQPDVVGGEGTTYPHAYIMDIIGYKSTRWKSSLIREIGSELSGGVVAHTIGLWRSTSAITSIVIVPQGNQFATGTKMSLYGIL